MLTSEPARKEANNGSRLAMKEHVAVYVAVCVVGGSMFGSSNGTSDPYNFFFDPSFRNGLSRSEKFAEKTNSFPVLGQGQG